MIFPSEPKSKLKGQERSKSKSRDESRDSAYSANHFSGTMWGRRLALFYAQVNKLNKTEPAKIDMILAGARTARNACSTESVDEEVEEALKVFEFCAD